MEGREKYRESLALLNSAQQAAVEQTDGVVMVIAGPGSGKTQLLSVRIAHILETSDTAPQNILCLTYTDTAAFNMRERVSTFTGDEIASRVTISTFHSFGVDILARYTQFFELESPRSLSSFDQSILLRDLVLTLPYSSSFRSYNPAVGYVYLRTVTDRISELKKAGLEPKNFRLILEATENWCQQTAQAIQEHCIRVSSGKAALECAECIQEILEKTEAKTISGYATLKEVAVYELQSIINELKAADKPKSVGFNEWKKKYLQKTGEKSFQWDFSGDYNKFLELATLYSLYQDRLTERGLIDFDDMVLLVAKKLQSNSLLRTILQEQYQYILVDEFQDNNKVQNEILYALGDNPVNEQNPNLLVVGDDDQAIYKFGGANLNVMKEFIAHYPKTLRVDLNINYRSTEGIINLANQVIAKATDRYDENKVIKVSDSKKSQNSRIESRIYPNTTTQMTDVAVSIEKLLQSGAKASDIAVIAKEHKSLQNLVPLLNHHHIPVHYERATNILKNKHVQLLIAVMRYTSTLLYKGESVADEHLPQILSHPCWGISRLELWKLSTKASRARWLDALRENSDLKLQQLADFFLELAKNSEYTSAEETLSAALGTTELDLGDNIYFTSPLKACLVHTEDILQTTTIEYLETLSGIKTLLQLARDTNSTDFVTTTDLLKLIDHATDLQVPINSTVRFYSDLDSVTLLSAHKAKGLEFEYVFLLDATENNWLKVKRMSKLNWPPHLQFSPEIDTEDDAIRLLYVAITRTKNTLIACTPLINNLQKPQKPLAILEDFTLPVVEFPLSTITRTLELELFPASCPPYTTSENQELKEIASRVRLSASSFTAFLELTHSGPYGFLEHTLLRFPEAVSTDTKFGTVMHSLFENTLQELRKTSIIPPQIQMEQAIPNLLKKNKIRRDEWVTQTERAKDVLHQAYETVIPKFTLQDIPEYNFGQEGILIDHVPVIGIIDRLVKTEDLQAIIFDYKTGKPLSLRSGVDLEWQKQKYLYQFLFYKCAMESSHIHKDLIINRGIFQFVDTKKTRNIEEYEIVASEKDVQDFKKLLKKVYSMITTLSLPTPQELQEFWSRDKTFDGASNIKFVESLLTE